MFRDPTIQTLSNPKPPDRGLFEEQDLIDAQMAGAKRLSKLAKNNLAEQPVGCDHCTLKETWFRIKSRCMKMSGEADADILFLGEAPGELEDKNGKQFIGPSGTLLRENIPRRHLYRIALQNTVRCRPDDNRDPTPSEVHSCSVHLNHDIDSLPLRAIVGTGRVPLRKYFPGGQIGKLHGTRFPVLTANGSVWYYAIFHPAHILHMAKEEGRDDGSALPTFQSDLRRFFKEVDKWEAPYVHTWINRESVTIARTAEEARAIIARMQPPVGIDIETFPLHSYEMNSKLLTAAISDGKLTVAFPCEHPENPTTWGLEVLLEVLLTKRWIAHNASFELGWFQWYWPNQRDQFQPFDDSMGLGRLYHQRNSIVALEDLSMVHLGVNIKNIVPVDARHIMNYPLSDVLPYNGLDALASALIYRQIRNKVHEANYQRILGAIVSTTDMEIIGLPVDLPLSAELKVEWEAKHQAIVQQVNYHEAVAQFTQDNPQIEFNIQSNDHIGYTLTNYCNIPLEQSGTQRKSFVTDEAALTPYIDQEPLVRLILDQRDATKTISTYIRPILEVPKRYTDALLHGGYTTMLTHPFRLSSKDPNMQNFPKHKQEHFRIRSQVVAEAGCQMVKFDFGQLQVRIIGMATRDKNLCKKLIDKDSDMHQEWLDRILLLHPDYMYRIAEKTGETEEGKILKGGRQLIKSDFVFANFFGASMNSICERTSIPEGIIRQIMIDFWGEFPEVRVWIKERRAEYRDEGIVTSMAGHVRRGILTGNEPLNAPIQFGEAVIVMDAMNELNEMARREKNRHFMPRIQIHDDLTFMLPDDNDLPAYIEIIQGILVRKRFPWQIVPLNVEGSIGPNWGSFEKFATFEGDYHKWQD